MESFTGQVIWSQGLERKERDLQGGRLCHGWMYYIYESLKNYVHHLIANEIRSGLYFHKSYTF